MRALKQRACCFIVLYRWCCICGSVFCFLLVEALSSAIKRNFWKYCSHIYVAWQQKKTEERYGIVVTSCNNKSFGMLFVWALTMPMYVLLLHFQPTTHNACTQSYFIISAICVILSALFSCMLLVYEKNEYPRVHKKKIS